MESDRQRAFRRRRSSGARAPAQGNPAAGMAQTYRRVPSCECGAQAQRAVSVPQPQLQTVQSADDANKVVVLGVDIEAAKDQIVGGLFWLLEKARPLSEFFRGGFESPKAEDLADRMKTNISHFFYNYALIFIGAGVVTAINHPISGILFACAAKFIGLKAHNKGRFRV